MRRSLPALGVNAALVAIAALTLFPLLWMVSASLMSPGESAVYPPPLWPAHATLDNYRDLFARAGMGRRFLNSLGIASAATLLSLLFNVGAGYAFAKLKFPGSARIQRFMVGALVIPAQVAMLPLFLMLKEAARLEGAGEFAIFRLIVLPLLTPILVTLAVFTFLGAWNDFLWPLIVLNEGRLYTLPVALASLSREHVQDSELMMAGSVLTVLPVLALFLVLQRYYLQGLMSGAVKG
jgi:multiple sugar transport system permease protein